MIKNDELNRIINRAIRGTYSCSEAMDVIERLARELVMEGRKDDIQENGS